MTGRFPDAPSAGQALAPLVADWLAFDARAVECAPDAVVLVAIDGDLAQPVAAATGLPVILLAVTRATGSDGGLLDVRVAGPSAGEIDALRAARTIIVLDRGVETGHTAMAVASSLMTWRGDGAARACALVLGVGVCPRQAQPELETAYHAVIAVHRPIARRSLRWHYADLS